MSRRSRLALSVLLLVTAAVALPPSCTEMNLVWVDQYRAITSGLTSGTNAYEIVTKDTCDIFGIVYHTGKLVVRANGHWDALRSPEACWGIPVTTMQASSFSTGMNYFRGYGYERDFYLNPGTPGCHETGVVTQVSDSCSSKPCCGPGTGYGCGSPIVLDTNNVGFVGNFVGEAEAKRFDLAATGTLQRVSWPRRGSGIMFLVRDVNGDGHITSGKEMYGDATCNKPNGYLALRLADKNYDGVINEKDAVFSQLRLWDGYTVRLYTMAEMGITAINLSYEKRPKWDNNGNGFILWSNVRGTIADKRSVDVYLRVYE